MRSPTARLAPASVESLFCQQRELLFLSTHAYLPVVLPRSDQIVNIPRIIYQVFKLHRYSTFVHLSKVNFIQITSACRPTACHKKLSVIVYYDCCIKSCVALTSEFERLQTCPICQEPRYLTVESFKQGTRRSERPRQQFAYIPLSRRLQLQWQS